MYKCSRCGSINVTVVDKGKKMYCNECNNIEWIRTIEIHKTKEKNK